ncbi:MAG: alpha/beta hydrolase [Lunatimonas sp.]|uniref:alpha/beta fold hydrolase n=1 Tax=Lunatimonas sp. TaxID=2060141 RepID=UPI00263B9363|nr:alpha/beta hydrolase [Lunatimonas sp.]MCC5937405.1 alpha/beta hydrolase [Lunatimonas sp.]
MPDIAYTKKGNGPAAILIHGFCESKEMWESFQSNLAATHTVYCPDLPGFGESPLPETSEFSIAEVATCLQDWMEQNNITHPVLIGHSLGGYVSLALAQQLGSRVKGLCLFHSTALPDDDEKRKTRNKTLTFFKKHGAKPFVESFLPQLFPEDKRGELGDTIEKLLEKARMIPVDVLIAYTKAMRDRPDSSELLRTLPTRKGMIAGELDTAVTLENSRKHSDWVDHYLELKGTGHMGMFEKPNETLMYLEQFLAKTLED